MNNFSIVIDDFFWLCLSVRYVFITFSLRGFRGFHLYSFDVLALFADEETHRRPRNGTQRELCAFCVENLPSARTKRRSHVLPKRNIIFHSPSKHAQMQYFIHFKML